MPRRSHAAGQAGDHAEAGQRQLRVGEALRHALSEILARGDLRDPALSGASITVTEVRMSPDLRNATVFVCRLGGGEADGMLAGLRRAGPWLAGRLARMARMKFAPRLHFQADDSFDRAMRIDALLDDAPDGEGESDER